MKDRRAFRWRLALAVMAAAVLPLVLFGAATLSLTDGTLLEAAADRHRAVLGAFQSGLALVHEARLRRLRALAGDPAVQRLGGAETDAALEGLRSSDPLLKELTLLDATGRVVARSPRASPGRNPEGAGDQSAVRIPVTGFAEPDRLIGVLIAVTSPDASQATTLVEAYPADRDEYVCLLSRDGTILARAGTALDARAIRITLPTGSLPGEADTIATIPARQGGRQDLLTVSRNDSLGGLLVVGRPADRAARLRDSLRDEVLLAALLAAVLAALVGSLLAGAVGRPVGALVEGLERLRSGVLTTRVEVEGDAELRRAATALNELAEDLERRRLVAEVWEEP